MKKERIWVRKDDIRPGIEGHGLAFYVIWAAPEEVTLRSTDC
jgi:hypothetical protein